MANYVNWMTSTWAYVLEVLRSVFGRYLVLTVIKVLPTKYVFLWLKLTFELLEKALSTIVGTFHFLGERIITYPDNMMSTNPNISQNPSPLVVIHKMLLFITDRKGRLCLSQVSVILFIGGMYDVTSCLWSYGLSQIRGCVVHPGGCNADLPNRQNHLACRHPLK